MNFDDVDFFMDPSVHTDPYPYFEFLRQHGPVWREPHHGVVVVSGLRAFFVRPLRRSPFHEAHETPARSRSGRSVGERRGNA